jgi:hypothetical protein
LRATPVHYLEYRAGSAFAWDISSYTQQLGLRNRCCAQLVCAGIPHRTPQQPVGQGTGVVGLDLGPSTLAVVAAQEAALLQPFCPEVPPMGGTCAAWSASSILLALCSAKATSAMALQAALNVSSVRRSAACWSGVGASLTSSVCFIRPVDQQGVYLSMEQYRLRAAAHSSPPYMDGASCAGFCDA